jgi:hypothetical protein
MKPAPGKENRYWAMLYMDNNMKFVEVPKAYKVSIEGFEDLELFAYKAWIDGVSGKGNWYVVEATSGLRISATMRTKAQAIQNAKEALLSHGAAETQKAIKSGIDTYGLSPRYQAGGAI